MGEAKRRGTREQREAEGREKRVQQSVEAQARRDARWASMTDEQRKTLVMLLATAAAMKDDPA